jgi:hypothetical protein
MGCQQYDKNSQKAPDFVKVSHWLIEPSRFTVLESKSAWSDTLYPVAGAYRSSATKGWPNDRFEPLLMFDSKWLVDNNAAMTLGTTRGRHAPMSTSFSYYFQKERKNVCKVVQTCTADGIFSGSLNPQNSRLILACSLMVTDWRFLHENEFPEEPIAYGLHA